MERTQAERVGTAALVFAAALVGASILAGGGAGRALNGAGAVAWMLGCGVLLRSALRSSESSRSRWAVLLGSAGALAFLVRPSDLMLAIAAFGSAGALMTLVVERRWMLWATLVPATYLPMHVGAALIQVALRSLTGGEASIRSEPPPTAAMVPLLMIAAAIAGGWIVSAARDRILPGWGQHRSTST